MVSMVHLDPASIALLLRGLGLQQELLLQGVSLDPSPLPSSFWMTLHSRAGQPLAAALLIPVQRPQSSQKPC